MNKYRGWKKTFTIGMMILIFGLFLGGLGIHSIVTKMGPKPAFLNNMSYDSRTGSPDAGRPAKMEGISIFIVASFLVCAVIFIPLGGYIVFDFLTGHDRAVRKFLARNHCPELKERVKVFLEQTREAFEGVQINKEFVLLHSGGLGYYLDYSDNIIDVNKSVNLITEEYGRQRKRVRVCITFHDKEYTMVLEDEALADKIILYLKSFCLGLIP